MRVMPHFRLADASHGARIAARAGSVIALSDRLPNSACSCLYCSNRFDRIAKSLDTVMSTSPNAMSHDRCAGRSCVC